MIGNKKHLLVYVKPKGAFFSCDNDPLSFVLDSVSPIKNVVCHTLAIATNVDTLGIVIPASIRPIMNQT